MLSRVFTRRYRTTRVRESGAALLLEAILAIGLMGLSIGVFFLLFQVNQQRTAQSRSREVAGFLANQMLVEVSSWSRQQHLTSSFSDWGPYAGGRFTFDDYPGFSVSTAVEDHLVESPCTAFEAVYEEVDQRRRIRNCVKRLTVTVEWGSGHQHVATTLMALPTLTLGSTELDVSLGSDRSLSRDGNVDLSVAVVGTPRSAELSDLFYQWQIRGNGNGTLDIDHHSRSGRFTNAVTLPPDARDYYTGMDCRVEARARYAGQIISSSTGLLELAK